MDIRSLVNVLSSLISLTHLSLSSVAEYIPAQLGSLKHLQQLAITETSPDPAITGYSMENHVPLSLMERTSLTKLVLGRVSAHAHHPSVCAFPHHVTRFITLRTLMLKDIKERNVVPDISRASSWHASFWQSLQSIRVLALTSCALPALPTGIWDLPLLALDLYRPLRSQHDPHTQLDCAGAGRQSPCEHASMLGAAHDSFGTMPTQPRRLHQAACRP